MPWNVIASVSSGLTLVAFITAAGIWAYRQRILQKERLIRLAPEEKRAELVDRVFEAVNIDTSRLNRQHRYELALRLIESRARRFYISAIVVTIFGFLIAALAAVAITQRVLPENGGNPDVLVWVNTHPKSNMYHCPGTQWYGKTETGMYMTQGEARQKGYRPAYGKVCR